MKQREHPFLISSGQVLPETAASAGAPCTGAY